VDGQRLLVANVHLENRASCGGAASPAITPAAPDARARRELPPMFPVCLAETSTRGLERRRRPIVLPSNSFAMSRGDSPLPRTAIGLPLDHLLFPSAPGMDRTPGAGAIPLRLGPLSRRGSARTPDRHARNVSGTSRGAPLTWV